ncbi:chemotaxis protein CheW [uncultured Ralstonia sp.]|jgi:chemotaxis-related protein WspB|uniref:chemotaxis protein CheW n=1 Tax=Ralstonia sp. TaxID=54061 RepID=UPI001EA8EA71|nr:chemotaxis protein CheW [uncultured Ralstonia sp.]UCF25142.1 MAG: chemotaxis protein CheW [Ralstonia sp.]
MLYLLFELDDERYALGVAQIAEVLALSSPKSIPGAPAWVAGVIERNGVPVPVIDVSQLALGRPARPLRSTRLVLVRYEADGVDDAAGHDEAPLLGLILERATHTRRIEAAQFADSGVATPHARWLGPVASDATGLVQRIEVQQMLDDDVRALLFPALPAGRAA